MLMKRYRPRLAVLHVGPKVIKYYGNTSLKIGYARPNILYDKERYCRGLVPC